MNHLAPWQRALRLAGDLILLGGAAWALYLSFVARTCPAGAGSWITPYNMIIGGLLLSTGVSHPFGKAQYLRPAMRRARWFAILLWLLGLLGGAFALYWFTFSRPQWSWLLVLVPLIVYMWLGQNPQPQDEKQPGQVNGDD